MSALPAVASCQVFDRVQRQQLGRVAHLLALWLTDGQVRGALAMARPNGWRKAPVIE